MSFSQADYEKVLDKLRGLSDETYKEFHEGLIPGTRMAYGVRVPEIRRMARELSAADPEGFLAVSQADSYEEILLRGIVIASMKTESETRLELVQGFLPLIGNWAVCDTFCSSFSLKKAGEREEMWAFLQPLFRDPREFYARFAAVMLLDHYVTEEYIREDLALLETMRQEQYYVQMAVAWAVCECYVKFPGETGPLLEKKSLPAFVQNKAIQKIRESRRVGRAEKDAMLSLKL